MPGPEPALPHLRVGKCGLVRLGREGMPSLTDSSLSFVGTEVRAGRHF